MTDIFISYSSKDTEKVRKLASILTDLGWSVWWDKKIPPGKTFDEVIVTALKNSKCILVIWTKNSVKSEWVKNEAAEGFSQKSLVPILLEDVDIPFEFRRLQAAKLQNWTGNTSSVEFKELIYSIENITKRVKKDQTEAVSPAINEENFESDIQLEDTDTQTKNKKNYTFNSIRRRISSPDPLTYYEQKNLLRELERHLKSRKYREKAIELLKIFQGRYELNTNIAKNISSILREDKYQEYVDSLTDISKSFVSTLGIFEKKITAFFPKKSSKLKNNYCRKCGKNLQKKSNFCNNCGCENTQLP